MSIFSVKKTVRVASVVYNMGGPEEDRPEFLKSIVLGNMLSRGNNTMGETIVNNYLNGPAMKLRSFYRWAETNYTAVGIPRDTFASSRELSQTAVLNAVSAVIGETIKLDWVEMAIADPTYWAIQWMALNMPDEEGDWEADYDEGDEFGTITFADELTPPVQFTLDGYVYGQRYIYASYVQATGTSTDPLITGDVEILDPLTSFPSVAGWILTGSSTTPFNKRLTTTTVTTKSYSDGRPNEVTTSEVVAQVPYEKYVGVYMRTTYNGVVDGSRTSTREYMTLVQDRVFSTVMSSTTSSEVIEGVTVTTLIETAEDTLTLQKTVRIDSQTVHLNTWSSPRLFIYRKGSGNATLDDMFKEYELGDGYFPMIPIRLNSKFVSETYEPALYEQSKKAYKKAFNSSYDDIIEKLADNEKIGDIDFAYVVFGANLNTKNVAARQYIYEYFHRLMGQQQGSASTDIQNWADNVYADYENTSTVYRDWSEVQAEIGEGSSVEGYSPEPEYPTFQGPPVTELRVKSNSSVINFDMQIDWDSIKEIKGTGEGKPGAKAGDIWFTGEARGGYTHAPLKGIFTPSKESLYKNEILSMWWQVTATSWKRLDITGLVNHNYVWKGKSVNTWGIEALLDEEESAFIVPMHEDVYRKLPVKVATEMSGSSAHMLLNAYVIQKQHWYQRGIFKIFAFIAAVVITIINPPAGLATFATLIGVNIVVAAIILVAVNMIAAMILMKILTPIAVAIFGEKVGRAVAAIATFFVTLSVGNFLTTGSAAITWTAVLNPINLMALTNAIGNGIAAFTAVEAQEYAAKTQDLVKKYEGQMEDLAQKYKDVLGDGISYIDPMGLTENSYGFYEPSETFLSRTLLTGSDIAELSHTLLNEFPEITLRLDPSV